MNEPTAIFTILVLVVTFLVSYRGFQNRPFRDGLLFSTEPILRDRQVHRILTSGFIHADWQHLLFNMFSLYSFGSHIELVYGAPTLLLIYFSSIVGGGLLALGMHRHHEYRALGASGGVCGVIYAAIFLLPGSGVRMFLIPFTIPAWAFAILFILGSYYGMRAQRDNIGHDAHLGGALVGLAVATALVPDIVSQRPVLYFSVVVLAVVLLVFMFRFPPSRVSASPFNLGRWRTIWADLRSRRETGERESQGQRLNVLLEKISREGLESLTPRERKELEEISRKNSRRK
jgi:membrane associated rhomboid family serine protease